MSGYDFDLLDDSFVSISDPNFRKTRTRRVEPYGPDIDITLHGIGIQNLKSIKTMQSVELKPITIFIGPNGSGKSNFIKFLRLMAQSITSDDWKNPLVLGGKFFHSDSYENLLYRDGKNQRIRMKFSINKVEEGIETEKFEFISLLNISKKTKRERIFLEKFIINKISENKKLKLLEFHFNEQRKLKKSVGNASEIIQLMHSKDLLENPIIKDYIQTILYDLQKEDKKYEEIDREFLENLIKQVLLILSENILTITPAGLFIDIDSYYFNLYHTIPAKESEKTITQLFPEFSEYYITRIISKLITNPSFRQKGKIDVFLLREKYIKDIVRKILMKFISMFFKRYGSEIQEILILSELVSSTHTYLDYSFSEILYLEPVRISPKGFYVSSGMSFTDIGIRGEHLVEILDIMSDEKRALVDQWLINLELAKKIELEPLVKGRNIRQLKAIDPATNLKINMIDAAFGFSQILPLIVAGIHCASNSTIILEQPEIHLNPRIQSKIGDFLIYLMKNREVNTIIETHSEHIILRLQRRIAENKLSTEDVGIYYFEATEKGTKIKKLEIMENGQFKNWPDGFFEDDLADAFRIAETLTKRHKSEK